jgi:hypothetical protein
MEREEGVEDASVEGEKAGGEKGRREGFEG